MFFSFGVAAMLFSKAMDVDIASAPSWHAKICLSPATLDECLFWETAMHTFEGCRPLWPLPGPKLVIHTDAAGLSRASPGGWGAWCHQLASISHAVAHGLWDHHFIGRSSTALELQAVLNALLAFNQDGALTGTQLQICTDAKNVWHSLMKGRSFAGDCVAIAQQILLYAFHHHIQLEVDWVPRELNTVADDISKYVDQSDWQLNPSMFSYLNSMWGPFAVDLFASASTTQLPMFFSKFYTVGSSGVNAFSFHWDRPGWAYPPVSLVSRILVQAESQCARLCLVVPHWIATAWWARLVPGGVFFNTYVHGFVLLLDEDLFRMPAYSTLRPPVPLLAILLDYSHSVPARLRAPSL
jgi:ribonuclease HI